MMQKMVERTTFSSPIPSSSATPAFRSSSPSPFSSVSIMSPDPKSPTQFLMGLGVQILEGRLPDHQQTKGFLEGDHCTSLFKSVSHFCDYETNPLCRQLASLQFLLMSDPFNLTLEVVLSPSKVGSNNEFDTSTNASHLTQNEMLIEKWRMTMIPQEEGSVEASAEPTTGNCTRSCGGNGTSPIVMTPRNLHNAVRSFLHFSQLAAWLSKKKEFTSAWKVRIDMTDNGAVVKDGWDRHEFPAVILETQPTNQHQGFNKRRPNPKWMVKVTVDSLPRMENFPPLPVPCHVSSITKPCLSTNKSQMLYNMLEGNEENVSGVRIRFRGGRSRRSHTNGSSHRRPKNLRIPIPNAQSQNDSTFNGANAELPHKDTSAGGNSNVKIPTLRQKLEFETSLNQATSLVFHKSGLPLTSSPAPIRRSGVAAAAGRFDFDSSLVPKGKGCFRLSEPSQSLLGSFEESVLNGRIEPVSTVEGFTAEVDVGSSHNFKLPVTVFFYTFCDNDRVSAPYMAHVTLSPTVYPVPRRGTLQVTLYNPMKTVVKMFVINYDLSTMAANSQTFIRQKILFMPLGKSDRDSNARKWLRYLIHLRFGSSEDGSKIYLHKDIRMIVLQKSDADTAVSLSSVTRGGSLCKDKDKLYSSLSTSYELRSFTYFADSPSQTAKAVV